MSRSASILCLFFLAALASGCAPSVRVVEVTATPLPTSTPRPLHPLIGAVCDERGCSGDAWIRPSDGMAMVYVPAGTFEMGSTEGQQDEQPVHTVTLDGFWIDRTEVTNEQYGQCVAAGTCQPPTDTDSRARDTYFGDPAYADYPVVKVGWHDARIYCEWAEARLPTEAEWEYAVRGSDGFIYPWGSDAPDCEKANYMTPERACVGDTAPVGSYPAGVSWCGAYDLAGNVWEWVADRYGEYLPEHQANPIGATSGRYRGIRGGSWFNDAFSMRGANRDRDPPQSPYAPGRGFYSLGFRCAQSGE